MLGGAYSVLGLAMVSSLTQNRTAARIYLGAFALSTLVTIAAFSSLIRARRRSADDVTGE
jgi:hypothetical protein